MTTLKELLAFAAEFQGKRSLPEDDELAVLEVVRVELEGTVLEDDEVTTLETGLVELEIIELEEEEEEVGASVLLER